MKCQHVFGLLGLILIAGGLIVRDGVLLAVWLGGNAIALALAHARGGHRLYGKRPDGTLPWWSWVLFLPLLAHAWLIWRIVRRFNRDPAWSVITPQLVVGGRLRAREFEGGFENYVDLTAEFAEPAVIRRSPAYRSFPILDFSAPMAAALHAAVLSLRPGRTFVHCAQGHGRAALFALAVLLKTGTARSVEEGWAMLRAARPGVRLSRAQQACIRRFAELVTERGDAIHHGSSPLPGRHEPQP